MNKKEFSIVLAHRLQITQPESKRFTDEFISLLMMSVAEGKTVKLSGFGTFRTVQKLRRSSRKRVVFNAGRGLTRNLNAESETPAPNTDKESEC